jgi:hypothetical protein
MAKEGRYLKGGADKVDLRSMFGPPSPRQYATRDRFIAQRKRAIKKMDKRTGDAGIFYNPRSQSKQRRSI